MLKIWTLQHFKSVCDKTTLELAPLTIFAGANSSGKSTLIQSILLTAQTLQSPVRSRSIIMNGHIVRLGAFKDVVSNSHKSNVIFVGFQLAPNAEDRRMISSSAARRYLSAGMIRNLDSIDCHFTFSAGDAVRETEELQLQPRLEESGITTNFKTEEITRVEEILIRRSAKSIQERLAQYQLSDKTLQRLEFAYLEYEVETISTYRMRIRPYGRNYIVGQPVGASFLHFLPERIFIVYDTIEEQSKQMVEAFTNLDEPLIEPGPEEQIALNKTFKKIILSTTEAFINETNLRDKAQASRLLANLEQDFSAVNMRNIAAAIMVRQNLLMQKLVEKREELLTAARAGRQPEYSIAGVPLSSTSDFAVDYTQDFFTRLLKYLGPLRDEPKPVYPLAGATDPKDIGFRGEHTAAVLDVHRNTTIEYIPSTQISSKTIKRTPQSTLLINAVQDWLGYMGVASSVKTVDRGKLGHELQVQTTGSDYPHDLTHVGVGVSQVLPILVLSLLAEPGSTLIFEQPELHLHPRVQTRLADFFVSMTLLKKQCIVETHSEYLINRLRYLSARSEGDEVASSVIVYFVEKEQGQSTYRPIKVNEFGVIEDWPKGFFDESEETSAEILRAGMAKRRKETGNYNG